MSKAKLTSLLFLGFIGRIAETLTDAYSKEIVGWAVGETLKTGHCIHALRMALKRVDDTSGKELIHHSDRGCQYASKEYTSLLREYGITISMTEDGNPKDNAQAERINNTIREFGIIKHL